jgi:hypothetical protein
MNFCGLCGSSSRDKDGFCGGCGAAWPLGTVAHQAKPSDSSRISPITRLSRDPRFLRYTEIRPKKVWVAIPLAVIFGPFGLLYCTMTGAIVMALASVPLWLLLGNLSYVVIPAISAFWAWRAARQSPSILD